LNTSPILETDLAVIALRSEEREEENQRFRTFIRSLDDDLVDAAVQELNSVIEPAIDCTVCGNCCRTLMINVEPGDEERLAAHLNMPVQELEARYIERSETGTVCVMSRIPCHFLADNKCTVYSARPTECRVFPGLAQKKFSGRMFATLMHYGRCPIIYNTIESLKQTLGFN
jgi:uncharacterized protein